jgi:uncharacterized membrane protein YccC
MQEETPRQMRLSSRVRGVIITALIAGYGWLFNQPQSSPAELLLVSAALQAVVILLRRWVPPDNFPQAMFVFEMIVDGVSVLLFALGVFGSLRVPNEL